MTASNVPPAPVEVIPVEPLVLRETDAARVLSVAPATMRHWRKIGFGPKFRRFGTAVVYSIEALKAFVAQHPEYQSTTEADMREAG